MELTHDKFISESELKKLLRIISESNTRAAVVDLHLLQLLSLTGLRISEALNLTWDNINNDYLVIEAQFSKNGKRQTVPLGKRAITLLKSFYDYNPYKGSPYLFNSAKGRLNRSSMHTRLKAWIRKAGLRESISLHSFRHGWALTALDSGLPLTLVRDTLRHSNISTTSQYLAFTKDSLEKLRNTF